MKENKLQEWQTGTCSTEPSEVTVRKLELIDKIKKYKEQGLNYDIYVRQFEEINAQKYK